ncbi:MAG TPA: GerMN domain-containing protein [Methylomusa anaerophila]|uniref:Sporulation and spore germination n=1 Tax=Methylomusa anaerophila TaxID=1930071 RepID=A0A348AMJ9_9FIRM|nr:GerMN domain-containing protein [Methylomusa anaerophila]BBB92297.1 sporulation and spore germination [Methylomusa anaerophila]HML90242.1 GerMN domain-containing protein [Methylomusa anaerophila]
MLYKTRLLLLAAMLLLGVIIAGCSGGDVPTSQTVPDSSSQTPASGLDSQPGGTSEHGTVQITVYYSSKDGMYLVPEVHKLDKATVGKQPARTAMEILLKGTKNQELVSPIPSGTKLKNFKVKDHIAYVDFDETLVKNHTGGSTGEIMTVGAIVDTLTEFPEIQKVQILVEGKKVDTIAGHLDTSEPLGRTENIIKR